MKEYENVFFDSYLRLRMGIILFQRSCRELVQDLPDKQIRDLVDLGTGWDDPELKETLQRRLGQNFEVYRASVKQLNKRINLVGKKLRLQEDRKV